MRSPRHFSPRRLTLEDIRDMLPRVEETIAQLEAKGGSLTIMESAILAGWKRERETLKMLESRWVQEQAKGGDRIVSKG